MTKSDNRIKKDARARAAQTGEPYTVARRQVAERRATPFAKDLVELERLAELDCEGAYERPVPSRATPTHRRALDRVMEIGGHNFGTTCGARRVLPDSTDIVGAEILAALIDAGGYPLLGYDVAGLLVMRDRLNDHRVRGVSEVRQVAWILATPETITLAVDIGLDALCSTKLVCGFPGSGEAWLGWYYTCSLEGRAVYNDLRALRATDWDARYGALWDNPPATFTPPQPVHLLRTREDVHVGGTRCQPAPPVADHVRFG